LETTDARCGESGLQWYEKKDMWCYHTLFISVKKKISAPSIKTYFTQSPVCDALPWQPHAHVEQGTIVSL